MKRKDAKGRVLRTNEYQRKDGRYAYQYKDIKGNRKYIYSWRLIETDAQIKDKPICDSLREMEKQIEHDSYDGIEAKSKITLNDRWDAYISNKPELKDSTRTNYKYMYDKYIRNDIGQMSIKSISYSVIKKFFNGLLHKLGFKANSVEIINTILHPVFTIAVRDGLIRLNPTEGVMNELKKSDDWEKPKRHALTKPQQKNFVGFVKENHPRWYPLVVSCLGTGCRIAEMLGLRWEDIHWKDNYISVNHNLIYRLQDDGTVKDRVTTTKTKNGNRLIPLLPAVKEILQKEYSRQEKKGFCKSVIDGYSGFIWMNKDGNVLRFHDFNRALDRIVKAYNKSNAEPLPHITAHILRHTFCCRLCENETDLKLIQEIMGHADITTTMDVYNESNMERKQERMNKLAKVIGIV